MAVSHHIMYALQIVFEKLVFLYSFAVETPENVFLLVDCPHDWLFPQCSAVVSSFLTKVSPPIK